MLKNSFLLLLFFVFGSQAWTAQTATLQVSGVSDKANEKAELRRQSFEKVWTTVNEKHFDPTFGGVDWKKIRETYEPKASAAKTDSEFHNFLQQMLNELKQSHFKIIPAEAFVEKPETRARGTIGIALKTIEDKPVIFCVKQNSPAASQGLKPGYIVRKINGKNANELRILLALLAGEPDTTVNLEVLDEKDQLRTFNLTRVAETAEYSPAIGNFPPQPLDFEARQLEKNIGYIRFNIWTMPQLAKIREALETMKEAPGIVFDVRGNPGGLGILAAGVAGNLVAEQISLGSLKFRAAEQKLIAYPQPNPYRGKVIILTDGGSASTSEIFAAGLQAARRARVVGETTMGAVLASIFDRLPTGAFFQYAVSDYRSPSNVLIEGRGVKPDVKIQLTRESLLAGRDLQIEAAIAEILK